MINFDDIVNENKTVHNKNWPYIKKREDVGIKHLNNPNAFIECSNAYDNINDYD